MASGKHTTKRIQNANAVPNYNDDVDVDGVMQELEMF